MFARQNLVILILSVILVASIIAILFLYPQYKNMKQALQACEKKVSEQNQKVAQLSEAQMKQMKSTYEALISGLKEQIQNQEVTIKDFQGTLSLTFVDRILFEFGKATLTLEGKKVLEKVGEAVKDIKGKKIRVTGHTDSVPIHPDYEYKFPTNWELSAARAATVVRYFQEKISLDPKDMEAIGHSFYQPVASNETKEGRARNRRVEIFIAPQMEIKGKQDLRDSLLGLNKAVYFPRISLKISLELEKIIRDPDGPEPNWRLAKAILSYAYKKASK